jgi:hypothetical protein
MSRGWFASPWQYYGASIGSAVKANGVVHSVKESRNIMRSTQVSRLFRSSWVLSLKAGIMFGAKS